MAEHYSDSNPAQETAFGPVIRKTRKQRGMTLAQVAEAAKVSVSYLSQVERNHMAPSVSALKRIADVLEIPAGRLMFAANGRTGNRNAVLVKRESRKQVSFPGANIRYEMLTPDLRRRASLLWLHAPPGAESGEPFSHEGEDGVVVLEGTLEVELGGTLYQLSSGDSIYFNSEIPHRWRNNGDREAQAIWLSTPPSF